MTGTTHELLAGHRFVSGLPEGVVELLASFARLVEFEPGALLLSEGDVADTLYLLYQGRVAIEVHGPAHGRIVVETVGPGSVVGLSWVAPPFRWQFDARALEPVAAVALDSEDLGALLEGHPDLGYALLQSLRRYCSNDCRRPGCAFSTCTAMAVTEPDVAPAGHGPLRPDLYRVASRRAETNDVVTLSLEPQAGSPPGFAPGQFNMVTAFGIGEVALSIASAPGGPGPIEHAIRDVGAVTHALCGASPGSLVGVRGPFGTHWAIDDIEENADVVVVAGGIGLAPLRGAVADLVARRRNGGGRVFVLVGARSPDQILFTRDLDDWRQGGAHVAVTVDVGMSGWDGPVGVVTSLLPEAPFDPATSMALLCGPEIMMRFAARALVDRGVDPERIRVSLERNMQCGIGLCGHCQLGPLLICRDGPVVGYGGLVERLFMERQR